MTERLVRFRWVLFALFILAVAALSPGLKTATVPDNALTVWFLETDPQLQTYYEFQEQFGNDEMILVLVDTPEGAFDPDVLHRVDSLSEELEAVDGVARAHSLLSVQDAWDTEEGLAFEPLVPRPLPEEGDEVLEEAAERALSNPLFRDRMVRADGKQTMVWVELEAMKNIDAERDRIVTTVRSIAEESFSEREYAMGGIGVIYSGLNLITQQDFGTFLGLGYLLMFVLMWWVFRAFRIVLAAIGVISLATVTALGVYGLLGHQINMVTVVIPTLVIVLGVADAVHMPSAFRNIARENPDASSRENLIEAVRRVSLPTTLTTLTTMGGFLALASSPMAVIRHLGIFSAIGLGTALLATFVLMTIALHAMPADYEPPEHRWLHRVLERAADLVKSRMGIVSAVTVILAALAGWGASTVVTDTYTIGYLPDDHRVVQDHEYIEREWGKYSLLDFVVRPADGYDMRDPDVIRRLDDFVEEAREHPLIRDGFTLADIYERMAAVYAGDPSSEWDGELTPEQIEQLSIFIEPKAFEWERGEAGYRDNFLAPLMTRDGELGRITLTSKMISAVTLQGLLDDMEEVAARTMGDVAELEPAGYPPLYVVIIDYVMSSQIRGFFIALAVIFTMMLIGLRSFRLALISLPPNLFPVLVMMGVMGAFDITLDVATATVGAIVIGISIDDTVHFLHHWKEAEGKGLSWEDALDHTLGSAGVAAAITTVILVGGFPVLMLAGVKTVVYFGLLTTISAAAAMYGDLFILPVLLKLWPRSR